MGVHLRSLAWNAGPRPGGDVFSDLGPDELRCERTPSRADATVRGLHQKRDVKTAPERPGVVHPWRYRTKGTSLG